MFDRLKKMFSGSAQSAEAVSEPVVEYKGFQIVASPQEGDGGWSTEAMISKQIGEELKTHHFIRADKTGSRDGAIDLTMNKCRQTIDQLGDRLFG